MKYLKNLAYKTALLAAILVAAPALCSTVYAQNETPEFDRLKKTFQEGWIFTSIFTHEYYDSFTGEQQFSEGKIWIGNDRYKIEGDSQQMLVDGETSTVYDGLKKRVIVSDYVEEEDDFAPSRMLQGADTTFSVSEEPIPDGGTKVLLESDDPFSVFRVVVIYIDTNGNPVRIEAIDQAENELITRFEQGGFEVIRDDMFQLEVPVDAELIDLRRNL